MKVNNYSLIFVLFLLITLIGCSDSEVADPFVKEISKEIREDIDKRFEKYEYQYNSSCDGNIGIVIKDRNENKASLLYDLNNGFQAEHRQIPRIEDLDGVVQTAFYKAVPPNMDISNLEIYKTERSYLKSTLYSFQFNDINRILINGDGTYLVTTKHRFNDEVILNKNYLVHNAYVLEKYKGADVRAQLNNGGRYLLIFFHDGYTKEICFGSDVTTDRNFWEKTEYEVSLDYPVPSHILEKLKKENPDFIYTKLIFAETPYDMQYTFLNYDLEWTVGYTIRDEK